MLLDLPASVGATSFTCGPVAQDLIIGAGYNVGAVPNITTADECCSLCGNTEGCVAWNLHLDNTSSYYHTCALHSAQNTSSPHVGSLAGNVSGATGCTTHSDGFWGSGHDLRMIVTSSATGCCAACRSDTACGSWVWHTDLHECYLHTSADGYVTASNVVAGVPSGPLPPVPPVPGEYVDGFACRDPGAAQEYKFCDPSLSLDERLADLVPRIADDEAGAQLTARQSPNISRIGLPSYCKSHCCCLAVACRPLLPPALTCFHCTPRTYLPWAVRLLASARAGEQTGGRMRSTAFRTWTASRTGPCARRLSRHPTRCRPRGTCPTCRPWAASSARSCAPTSTRKYTTRWTRGAQPST